MRWCLAVLLLAGFVACGSDDVEVEQDDGGCAELTVIGARGSGQGVDSAEPRGFGREAGAIALAVGAAAAEQPRGWRTAYVGVDYPAVDVPTARADPASFGASVRDGALDGLERAAAAVADCPTTQLVVVGSSQGAAVAHGMAALLAADPSYDATRERVLGVVLLGDPTRQRDDADVEHVDPGGVAPSNGFLADARLDVATPLTGRVLSVCAVGDTVCSSPPGTTWSSLRISPVHNSGYTIERIGPAVLAWLGSRPALS